MSAEKVCRWGFLSTAGIARKVWRAIWLSGNGRVAAVASRQESSARRFIEECQREACFSPGATPLASYDALLQRDDIDAVYVPLPTAMRNEWVIRAAEAGKHVLCEKPIAPTAAEAREMIDACAQNHVQFMDGVMFMHSARLAALEQVLRAEQKLGPIQRISSSFSFLGDEAFRRDNIRVMRQLEPHGCLGDLGWYSIRIILWSLNYQMPQWVSARCLTPLCGKGSTGDVPGAMSVEMMFPENVSASFYVAFTAENSQWVTFNCRNGHLTMDDFVLPFYDSQVSWREHQHQFEIKGCRFNMNRRTRTMHVAEYSSGEDPAQEVNLYRNFAAIALSGKLQPQWAEIALKTQQVLDACALSASSDGQMTEVR